MAKLMPMSSCDIGFHTRRPCQGCWAPRGRTGCIDNIRGTEIKFSRLQKHELPFGFNDSSLSKSTGTSRQPEMFSLASSCVTLTRYVVQLAHCPYCKVKVI